MKTHVTIPYGVTRAFAPDQGVCPDGHACYLAQFTDRPTARWCVGPPRSTEPGNHQPHYAGAPLVDVITRVTEQEYAEGVRS